uniref:Transcription factor bHLH122-like isoform X5 n=1 Tax=Rhizophora mucronata TaxID=61149 RepID=A0A2P2JE61_RHIMU
MQERQQKHHLLINQSIIETGQRSNRGREGGTVWTISFTIIGTSNPTAYSSRLLLG